MIFDSSKKKDVFVYFSMQNLTFFNSIKERKIRFIFYNSKQKEENVLIHLSP